MLPTPNAHSRGIVCTCINRLFAYCKGGIFNSYLGVVRLFHLLRKKNQVLFIIWSIVNNILARANVRAFHENPNRWHTELTFINP